MPNNFIACFDEKFPDPFYSEYLLFFFFFTSSKQFFVPRIFKVFRISIEAVASALKGLYLFINCLGADFTHRRFAKNQSCMESRDEACPRCDNSIDR